MGIPFTSRRYRRESTAKPPPVMRCFLSRMLMPFLVLSSAVWQFADAFPIQAAPAVPVYSTVNLGGRRLRGCALEEFPYVEHKGFGNRKTQGFDGPAIDYLEKLSEEANFTFHLTPWNGTWTGFIQHMASCAGLDGSSSFCKCDIGIGSFTVTSKRLAMVNFLSFANENHRMIVKTSSLSEEGDSWVPFMLKPFTWQVWLLVFAVILTFALGNCLVFGHNSLATGLLRRLTAPAVPTTSRTGVPNDAGQSVIDLSSSTMSGYVSRDGVNSWGRSLRPPPKKRADSRADSDTVGSGDSKEGSDMIRSLVVWAFDACRTFLGFPNDREVRPNTILQMAWGLVGLCAGVILLLVFESALTVHLLQSEKTSRFRTLDDVKQCVVDPRWVAFPSGGASQDLWSNAIVNGDLCTDSPRFAGSVLPKNIGEGLQQLDTGKAKFFFTLEGAILTEWQRWCPKYSIVGEPFFETDIGFVIPKHSPYKEPLSAVTRRLHEQDRFDSARTIAMRRPCNDTEVAKINHNKMAFFFFCFFGTAVFLIDVKLILDVRSSQRARR